MRCFRPYASPVKIRRGGPVWPPGLSLRHLLRKCHLPRQREAFAGVFSLAPSDEGAVERSETGGEIAPVSL